MWEKAAPPALTLKLKNSVSPVSPGAYQGATQVLELRVNESEFVRAGPLRGMAGAPAMFCLTQTWFRLVFTARSCGDFSSQH